jgi:hypothetical protein
VGLTTDEDIDRLVADVRALVEKELLGGFQD